LSEAFQQIEKALFDTALQLNQPDARAAFLTQACGTNTALRLKLEKLLQAHSQAEDFFSINPLEATARPISQGLEEDSLETLESLEDANVYIGRYKIIKRLGEGGCGVVYLAEQQKPVKRSVALKIIRLGMDTVRVISRFELERQALALMNHPHIAQAFDAGATDSGRPYFVMEWVRGESITDYCRAHSLNIRRKLQLFIQVCLAIQHAHQKGILHRDIKPSNVLVTEQDGKPVPKVIDFGVAKAVENHWAENLTYTAQEQLIGTPAYMSPEQAQTGRLDVDTRTDIYSLGALLYELLTDHPPFDSQRLLDAGMEEMRRILREKEPPTPSQLLHSLRQKEPAFPRGHHGTAPWGDLDWIVMKALEKDRQRRYPTVNDLVMDLRRYLNHEAVQARPPSKIYLLGKWIRRNRVIFSSAAAVSLALIAGLSTSLWLFSKERYARKEQARLHGEAVTAEMLTRAVFLTRENNYPAANAVLDQIHSPPVRASFDGVSAYRSVGNWLALQGRWQETMDRFSILKKIGGIDQWESVTGDYQSYGIALIESGNVAAYPAFQQECISAYSHRSNGDEASRILKICLLEPGSWSVLQQLRPIGTRAERWYATLEWPNSIGHSVIPISLWRYRQGLYNGAELYAQKGLDERDKTSADYATIRIILAMSAWKNHRPEEARENLEKAREVIALRFKQPFSSPGNLHDRWYDWGYARILLREASSLIGIPEDLEDS